MLFCGRLGHGINDCKEAFGVQSSVKNFGPWMKASPWKPVAQEEGLDDMGVKRSCGKRLFFSKKLRPKAPVEDSCPTSIHNVTSLLGKFVLDKDEEEVRDDEVAVGPPGYEQGLITEKGQDNTVQDNHDEGEFFDGSCQQVPFTSSTQIILEGSNEHGGLRQDSVGMTVPSQVSLTRKRVQKWKKVVRQKSQPVSSVCFYPPVGEKRPKEMDDFDDLMADVEDRVVTKKRHAPMEVDSAQDCQYSNEVSPTRWALGSQ